MKSTTILVAMVLFIGYTAAPQSTHAAGSYIINDTTAVFFLNFTADASYAEFGIPVFADHTVNHNDKVNVVGYELTTDSESLPEISNVADLILSTAPLTDMQYTVATGTTASFTLVSIVNFTAPLPLNVMAKISKLPYWTDGARTTAHQNQLDELPLATAVRR
jgi:hypothetical protein